MSKKLLISDAKHSPQLIQGCEMQYRRSNVKGATYFFTVNLANRTNTLLVDEFGKLRSIMNKVKNNHPFILDAFVVLPEHLHAMWTLPEGDNDFSKR